MQDYKMLVRAVWGAETRKQSDGSIHIQNAMEAQDYLNEVYLSNGYKVLSVDYLGEVFVNELEGSNSPRALRFAWHLVKDLESSKKKSVE